MKRFSKSVVYILAVAVFLSLFSIVSFAKELEECYHCNNTGKFHCNSCNNTGIVVCDGCQGKIRFECRGEDGKGKCNNGYYTCPSCKGDTYIRSGDGTIPPDAKPGTCGHCGGKGKLECWTCHGAGYIICTRCDGKGKCECQGSNCQAAKAVGWKCPYCNGAGYLLVGMPMPPQAKNDGVQNVPKKGDYIVTNNKTWAGYVYGESGSSKKSTTSSVDTSSKKSNPVNSDTSSITSSDAVSSTEPKTYEPAFKMPEDRNTDFEITVSGLDENHKAVAKVETGKMNDKEQQYYASLPEEKLTQILSNVKSIVDTAEPGKAEKDTEKILKSIADKNGFKSLEEAKIFPIYFEGHQDIGFPVKVTVNLDKGRLNGGSDIYIYHIAENGEIESLGKAEYGTYEDGSVESLSFYTTGFSSFFTANSEMDTDVEVEKTSPVIYIVIAVAATLVLAVAVLIILKKKKQF